MDNRVHNIPRDPDTVNSFLAEVASKQYYDKHELDIYRTNNDGSEVCLLTNIEAERLLCKIKLSAFGCVSMPAWLLRNCSYELADIVARIVYCSINSVNVPSYWLNTLVTPVPKVSNPASFSDFRPISVTPHLSRLTEKSLLNGGFCQPYQQIY